MNMILDSCHIFISFVCGWTSWMIIVVNWCHSTFELGMPTSVLLLLIVSCSKATLTSHRYL
jgi:hypothetical protein